MKKQTMAILAVVFVVLAALIYQGFFKKEKSTFTLAEVVRGEIPQEVSETGQVKKGEEIKLGFKNAGRIEKNYVEVGEETKAGDILAKLETKDLEIQLQEAKAALSMAQAKLDKLLAGASSEEIQKTRTAAANAKTALGNANQNLEDVKAQAAENLNAAYEDGLNALEDAFLKAENSQNSVDLIQRTYFTANDQEGLKIKENKEKIIGATSQIKSFSKENIGLSLRQTKEKLSEISTALKAIREICQSPVYLGLVSVADKSSLDNHRGYINTALTNISNSEQAITSTKLTNEANINTARARVSSAEGSLIAAEDDLALITAFPRQEDADLYQAQVRQAEAQVQLLENKIEEAVLKSPIQGQITDVKKRVGELVQSLPSDVVIAILPTDPFEIEVDIYEEDVVKMKIDNEVEISLVAFPGQTFRGKVVSIYPAEKLIEGVVYYKVIIAIERPPEGIKPGMTADVVIQTASKDNVLFISQSAIEEKDGKTIVKIVKGKNLEDREVQIGLKGSNDMVEVVSGLNEGETIAIPK